MQNTPKRKIKDSVFTSLFKEKKYLLQLYKTLHPEDDHVSEDEITDITIKNVLMDGIYNDLGFSVGNRLMVLVESQSTWSVNIIIRALMYLIQTYHDYFKRTNQNLYGSKKVNIPKPELYMIYTGERKDIPDTISFSNEFFDGIKIAIDAEVKVLYQANEKDIIGQYIIFCKVYNEQRKMHGNTKQAVTETIHICKGRNVLKEYLESKEMEVVDMWMEIFDDEYILKAYAKDIEASTAERVARDTEKKTARDTAKRMIKKGKMTLEEIADYVPSLSFEELKNLEATLMR